ncbi:MAG: flavin reductase family protein [Huintestinicola sp.]|uniref:flavin reductase family protein n=1 Tax=Huintestinicola sp. TaxID=2981661 RepID=UPI003F0ED256
MGRRFFKGGALIAPVPAALVTCGSEDGKRNVLTAAWTGIVNTRPPMAYVSIRPERHSHGIIMETGEFVINLTTSKMAKEVDFCGMKSGSKSDKFAKCGFETVKGETVSCPVILASPLSLECRVRSFEELGSHTMFIADITGVTADERYIDSKGKINLQQAGLMAYSHGEYFALGRKLGDFGFSVRKKGAGK